MNSAETFFVPGVSRYKLSVNYEFVGVNSKGVRRSFGGCQSINPTQTKNAQRSHELNNTPECIEVTQGLVTDLSLTVNRLQLNSSTLLAEFSGMSDVESLYDQCLYFDIEVVVYIPKINADGSLDPLKKNGTRKVLRVYKDCCITNYSETCQIEGDIRISETATIQCRAIKSPNYNPEDNA